MRLKDKIISYSDIPSSEVKVGSWRFVEPYLQEKKPPCQAECPLGHQIREVFTELIGEDTQKAYEIMADKNPLLYATGAVCPHFCEEGCNRQYVEESLNIAFTESELGRRYITHDLKKFQKSKKLSKRIAIIGGGPAGLTAAYQLSRYQAEIHIFEREAHLGGTIQYGIPDLRLDKMIFQQEIAKIIDLEKVVVETDREISVQEIAELKKNYDYILVGIGTQQATAVHWKNVLLGFEALKDYHRGTYLFPEKQGHFLVLGGGNTAMDVANYLLEKGNQVSILVRKSRERMRAFADEIKLVEKKGAKIITEAQLEDWDSSAGIARLKISENTENWSVSGVYACFGQEVEAQWQSLKEDHQIRKIGDIINSEATVVHAVASANLVVQQILVENKLFVNESEVFSVATKETINLDYWKGRKAARQAEIFKEAERCMQCGTCTACGICETFCPDFTVCVKEQAQFNYDYCKGCEICAEECPRGAISIREAKK